jgi:hypothetical protein
MDVVSSPVLHEKAAFKIHLQRDINDSLFLAPGHINGLHSRTKNQTIISLINQAKSNQNGCYSHNRLRTMLHSRILDLF